MIAEERERFEREYGCTEAEWVSWMPAATQQRPGDPLPSGLRVAVGAGSLTLGWQPLPPRRIALLQLPRLLVHFAFDGVAADERRAFLRAFDLRLQRGGG